MLTIDDFKKRSAQEFGEDPLATIDSEYSVYLVPEHPVEDLPELRVRIWPKSSVGNDQLNWSWNWRTVHPGPEIASPEHGPEIRLEFVGGETEYDTLYGSIAQAAVAAIGSINDYLDNELPDERRLKEQQSSAERERKDRIQKQVDDFLGK